MDVLLIFLLTMLYIKGTNPIRMKTEPQKTHKGANVTIICWDRKVLSYSELLMYKMVGDYQKIICQGRELAFNYRETGRFTVKGYFLGPGAELKLTITNLSADDAGLYGCQKTGHEPKTIPLDVRSPVAGVGWERITDGLGVHHLRNDETVTLDMRMGVTLATIRCSVTSYSEQPNIQIRFGNRTAKPDSIEHPSPHEYEAIFNTVHYPGRVEGIYFSDSDTVAKCTAKVPGYKETSSSIRVKVLYGPYDFRYPFHMYTKEGAENVKAVASYRGNPLDCQIRWYKVKSGSRVRSRILNDDKRIRTLEKIEGDKYTNTLTFTSIKSSDFGPYDVDFCYGLPEYNTRAFDILNGAPQYKMAGRTNEARPALIAADVVLICILAVVGLS